MLVITLPESRCGLQSGSIGVFFGKVGKRLREDRAGPEQSGKPVVFLC
jgi:hypothetical protein